MIVIIVITSISISTIMYNDYDSSKIFDTQTSWCWRWKHVWAHSRVLAMTWQGKWWLVYSVIVRTFFLAERHQWIIVTVPRNQWKVRPFFFFRGSPVTQWPSIHTCFVSRGWFHQILLGKCVEITNSIGSQLVGVLGFHGGCSLPVMLKLTSIASLFPLGVGGSQNQEFGFRYTSVNKRSWLEKQIAWRRIFYRT